MTVLLAFLETKVGKYTACFVVLLLATGVVAAHYHAKWKAEGEAKVHAQDLEQQKKELQADANQARADLTHAQQDANVAIAQGKAAMDLANRATAVMEGLSDRIAALENQRTLQTAALARIPDSGVAGDIQVKLGKRKVGDLSPGFTIEELRAIDGMVTDYPMLAQENTALGQKQTAMQDKLDALGKKIDADEATLVAVTKERDLATKQWTLTLAAYKQAYDEFPRKRGFGVKVCHVITFGLGCKTQIFKLQSPVEFAKLQ